MYEDGFANERSNSRISDYSASSGCDPSKSGLQSPNFPKDIGSPASETSRDFLRQDAVNYTGNAYPDSNDRRDGGRMPRPQVMFLNSLFSNKYGLPGLFW
jgi:Arf-GAP domain and FG repeats-containing protein 1